MVRATPGLAAGGGSLPLGRLLPPSGEPTCLRNRGKLSLKLIVLVRVDQGWYRTESKSALPNKQIFFFIPSVFFMRGEVMSLRARQLALGLVACLSWPGEAASTTCFEALQLGAGTCGDPALENLGCQLILGFGLAQGAGFRNDVIGDGDTPDVTTPPEVTPDQAFAAISIVEFFAGNQVRVQAEFNEEWGSGLMTINVYGGAGSGSLHTHSQPVDVGECAFNFCSFDYLTPSLSAVPAAVNVTLKRDYADPTDPDYQVDTFAYTACGSCEACLGDCNIDCQVTVDEIVRAVDIALGAEPMSGCFQADGTGDGQVTVDEVLQMVNSALNGCPAPGSPPPPPPSTTPVNFTVPGVAGYRGDTVSFPLTIANGLGYAAGLNIDLDIPTSVLTTPDCSLDPRLNQGQILNTAQISSTRQRLLLRHPNSPPSTFTDGVVVVCEAQILSGAPFGAHPIGGVRRTVSDAAGQALSLTAATGTVGHIVVIDPDDPGNTCAITSTPRASPLVGLLLVVLPVGLILLRAGGVRRHRVSARALAGIGVLLLLGCGDPVNRDDLAGSSADSGALSQKESDPPPFREPPIAASLARGSWTRQVVGRRDAKVSGRLQVAPLPGRRADRVEQLRRARPESRPTWSQRSWYLSEVKIEGSTLTGRLILVGASFLSVGRVEATFSPDGHLDATISDADGNAVASVDAQVSPTGIQGQIAASNGERGQWSWQARDPARFVADMQARGITPHVAE